MEKINQFVFVGAGEDQQVEIVLSCCADKAHESPGDVEVEVAAHSAEAIRQKIADLGWDLADSSFGCGYTVVEGVSYWAECPACQRPEPVGPTGRSKLQIVVEIPHQFPASAWVAWSEAELIAAACEKDGNADYTVWHWSDLIECFGEDGIPAEARDIIEAGADTVVSVSGIGEDDRIWRRVEDAPTEVEWAQQVLASDLHALHVLRPGAEVGEFLSSYDGHQAIVACIAVRKCADGLAEEG